MTRKLPADISRCNGHIYGDGKNECQHRDKCLRFLSPPHELPLQQRWIFVAGIDQVGDCSEFMKQNEAQDG